MAPLVALGIKAAPTIVGLLGGLFSGKKDPQKHAAEILDDIKGLQDRIKDGFKVGENQKKLDQFLWDIADSKRAILAGQRDPNTDGYSVIATQQIQAEYAEAEQKAAQQQTISGQIASVAGNPQTTSLLLIGSVIAAAIAITYLLFKK